MYRQFDISADWNFIGEPINDTNRIISVIKNLDDVIFVSHTFRYKIKQPEYTNDFDEYMTAKGRHKDKHGKSHRI